MKTLYRAFVIGATVIGLGSPAVSAMAQDTPHHQYAATKFDPAKMAEHMDKRAQKLHDALKITPAQESAWQTYLSAIKADMPQPGQFDRAAFREMPAPQRMEKMIEMSRSHTARMENHLTALKTFYAVLTPEQQKTFDHAMGHFGAGHHRMMMMHRQQ